MQRHLYFPQFSLQLFAVGAAGGTGDGGAGNAAGTTGVIAADAVPQTKGVKGNPLAAVKYGKQEVVQDADAPKEDEPAEAATPPDRNAEFERLIKGEYKDLYDAKVNETVRRRHEKVKETVDKYNALMPTLELLAKKYGVSADDAEALGRAVEEDSSYYEEEAMQKGVTVEELKRVKKIERENAELRRFKQEQQAREQSAKLYADWMDQAKNIKTVYPSFDLDAEMKNPEFVRILRAGIDMKTAFEVLHKDEIIPVVMQYTARAVEEKIANRVMAGDVRPSENGMSAQSAAITKSDVEKLTKADIKEIQRRVARGERISFG